MYNCLMIRNLIMMGTWIVYSPSLDLRHVKLAIVEPPSAFYPPSMMGGASSLRFGEKYWHGNVLPTKPMKTTIAPLLLLTQTLCNPAVDARDESILTLHGNGTCKPSEFIAKLHLLERGSYWSVSMTCRSIRNGPGFNEHVNNGMSYTLYNFYCGNLTLPERSSAMPWIARWCNCKRRLTCTACPFVHFMPGFDRQSNTR